MDINQIGLLLAYQRTRRNISVAELCEGICSRGFIGHVENGERGCEKIVAEALLQRVGFDSDQMLYFLEKEEADWLMIKEQLLEAVVAMKLEEVERLVQEYKRVTVRKSVLHEQFLILLQSVLRWKLYLNKEEKHEKILDYLEKDLKHAWCMTRENYDIEGVCPRVLSTFEFLIRILYFHVQEEKGRKRAALTGYQEMLRHIESNIEPAECAKFYPKLAYQMLCLLEEVGEEEEQERLYQDCLNIMRKEGSMSYLLELTIYRRRILEHREETPASVEEKKELENLIEALQWLYATYQRQNDWFTNMLFGREEVYVLSETIKNRRICFGMTQEELSEGICDPVTMSRIENGVSNCKRGRIGRLMDKLHLPGGAAVFSVQAGRADTYGLISEIRRLSALARYAEAEPLFSELKKRTMHDRCAEQFMPHKEATIQHSLKQIDEMTHWDRQSEALYKTLPYKKSEELEKWVFTRTEAMCAIALSYGCKKIGKTPETVEWLKVLKNYYERQPFYRYHYARGYELVLKNLANILDQTREYETAIAYEDVAIQLALELDTANVLWLTVYGRGWNMEQLWDSNVYTKEESRPYFKAAVALSRIYAKPSSAAFIKDKWMQLYEKQTSL